MMLQKSKELITIIRELIWPLLEPLQEQDILQIKEKDFDWEEEDLDLMLEYANKYYESEEARKQDVESKSTIFIGTFGVTATILIYLSKELVLNNSVIPSFFMLILISLMTLSVVYICRAIWFSLKALQRQNYYRLSFPRFMLENDVNKKKKLIIALLNYTRNNSETINLKVDFMTMAQEYFKRVVVFVSIFSILVLGRYILSYKIVFSDFFSVLNNLAIREHLLGIIIASIVLLYFLIMVIFYKLSKR
ncbi:hypothetical protein FHP05_05755 [Cerasibacillus terrae]|uniref:Uncharacterized protein n=1 Tax=Cerasibacillus terrae TaxID=2498845 RepID=A0A5C8NX04_9BACI|nr:hypothetical protein [Cerasibacillus terrae]TXL65629.1 hypothetical protein FHP05_05755 [Cerasibacillus terrae]